jgi:hypothetical protein
LIFFSDMVFWKQGGGQAGMVGDDLKQAADGILFEGKRVIGGDQAVFLGEAENSQVRMILYGPETNFMTQMIGA